MQTSDIPRASMPRARRIREAIYLVDFRQVDMIRTDALAVIRDRIDQELPPGSMIGTLMDMRSITQYSFNTGILLTKRWNHQVIRSAWLIDPANQYGSERGRASLDLPYPIELFHDHRTALKWLESTPGAPYLANKT